MLSGDSRAVVVANHTPDLEGLRALSRVHFSDRPHAWGILDGIDHFGFLDSSPSPSKAKERDA
jgi:sucrose-phosphate synthase